MWQYNYTYPSELYHHGILGQKWGVRRYQNKDGSLTPAGKKRYGDDSSTTSKRESKKEAKRLAKADKAWAKNTKRSAHKMMQDAMNNDDVQKECKNRIAKLVKSGISGASLNNEAQVQMSIAINNHLAKSSEARSPSGKQALQVGLVKVNGNVLMSPYIGEVEG